MISHLREGRETYLPSFRPFTRALVAPLGATVPVTTGTLMAVAKRVTVAALMVMTMAVVVMGALVVTIIPRSTRLLHAVLILGVEFSFLRGQRSLKVLAVLFTPVALLVPKRVLTLDEKVLESAARLVAPVGGLAPARDIESRSTVSGHRAVKEYLALVQTVRWRELGSFGRPAGGHGRSGDYAAAGAWAHLSIARVRLTGFVMARPFMTTAGLEIAAGLVMAGLVVMVTRRTLRKGTTEE